MGLGLLWILVLPPGWVIRAFSPGVHPALGVAVLLCALIAAGSVQWQRLQQSGIWRLSPYLTAVPLAVLVWACREPLSAWAADDGTAARVTIVVVMALAGVRWLAEVPIATAFVGAFLAPDTTLMWWYAVPASAGTAVVLLVEMLLVQMVTRRAYSALVGGRLRQARWLASVPLLLAPFLCGARRAAALDRVGALHQRLGSFRTAVACRKWMVRSAHRRGNTRLETAGLLNLAVSHHVSGQLEESLMCVHRAQQVLARHPARLTPDVVEHLTLNLAAQEAKAHKDMGDLHTSLAVTENTLELAKARYDQDYAPAWLRGLYADLLAFKSALVGVTRLDTQQALALLEQAHEVAESLGDEFRQFLRLQDQTTNLVRLGRFGEARARLERALRLLESGTVRTYDHDGNYTAALNGATDLHSVGLWALARISWMQGNTAEADRIAEEAFKDARPGTFLHFTKQMTEAQALLNRDDVAAAREAFDHAVRLAENSGQEATLRMIHTAAGRAYEQEGSQSDLMTAQGHYERVIGLIETARSSLADEATRLEFLGADSRIEAYARMVVTSVALGRPAEAFGWAERGKARALLDHLGSRDHLGGAGDAAGRPISHDEAQELLVRSGQPVLLVEYFTTDDQVIVIGLRGDGQPSSAVTIPVTGDALRRFALSNFGASGRVREMVTSGLEDMWHAFDSLVAPIGAWSRPGDLVILVPHGVLHHLPLHALRVGDQYLIERNPVSYAPSTSALRECRRGATATRGNRNTVVLGDPADDLPYARAEAVSVAAEFDTDPVLGSDATRGAFSRALSTAGLVHYAGHARFVADDPMSSGLLLADGALSSRDIAALPAARPRLVVLSGCETGVSKDHPGDDTVGLLRGFLYSGAPSVLATLWRVPDESTAHLVTRFYHHLRENPAATTAHALRSATLDTLKRPCWSSLYHWAPFALVGDWE
ncbi:CHAT domain-containing tetratricopeptide repeat protein [Streptomyces sp. NPDC048420]|uniref:CHAT domain-containing protein n=1 Tax=Streptomyces sp. NPDC048420 TaxID=3155755 RepID=UPI00342046FF